MLPIKSRRFIWASASSPSVLPIRHPGPRQYIPQMGVLNRNSILNEFHIRNKGGEVDF